MFANNSFYSTRIESEFSNNMFEVNELFADSSNRIESRSILFFFEYEVDNIVNNSINRIKPRLLFSTSELENLINLLNINEFAKAKTKKKFKKSQNKKKIITKVEKKTTNFTKRDSSNF